MSTDWTGCIYSNNPRDYGTMSRMKESSKTLPVINRSSAHKNSTPRQTNGASKNLQEDLVKANLMVRIATPDFPVSA